MDALKIAVQWNVFILLLLCCAGVASPPNDCLAADPAKCQAWHRPVFDGTTLCAWRRTWHGPNALDTPLTGYYIPRQASSCDCAVYANGCGEAVADCYITHSVMDCEYGHAAGCECAAVGVEPAGFDRLGQIPNDLDLAGGLPAGGSARPDR